MVGGGTESRLDAVANYVNDAVTAVIRWGLEHTYMQAVGTPTFDSTGYLGVFGEPTTDVIAAFYDALYSNFTLPLTLGFLFVMVPVIGAWIPFSDFIGEYSASRMISMVVLLIFALAIQMPIAAGGHLISDVVGTTIAPSPEELTETEQGILVLRDAGIAMAGGLYLFGWANVMIYMIVFGAREFLLVAVMPWVFGPALAMSIASPWGKLRWLGSTINGWYAGLLVINWIPALMWRGAYIMAGVEALHAGDAVAQTTFVIGALVFGAIGPIIVVWQMGRLGRTVRTVAAGAVAGAAARSSKGYVPDTAKRAKTAGRRARDIGRAATDRAHTVREVVRSGGNGGGGNGGSGGSGGGGSTATSTSSSPRQSGTGGRWSTQAGRMREMRRSNTAD